jgi:hypothetical protein
MVLREENRRLIAVHDRSDPDFTLLVILMLGGSLLLASAYGLNRVKKWGPPFGAFVSLLVILTLCGLWVSDGFAPPLIVVGVPISFTLIWCVAETVRGDAKRRVHIEG